MLGFPIPLITPQDMCGFVCHVGQQSMVRKTILFFACCEITNILTGSTHFRTSIFCIDCNHYKLGIFYSLNHLSGYMKFPWCIVSHFNYMSYMRKSTFTGPKKIFCSLCIVQFPNIFNGPTHFSTRHGLSTGFFHTDGRTNNLDMNQHPLFVWVLSLLIRYFHHSKKEN